MGRMKKRKAESGKRERRGDPCGRPGARRTDCHDQRSRWSRNDGLFARGTVGRRDTWVLPYTALLCRGRCLHRPGGTDFQVARRAACGRPCPPGSARSLWCVGEGLSCPPSCQPTGGHCRTRQSGHFLETGSLHPPLAALRRFPLPRATARVAPTDGNKERGKRGVEDAAPYGGEQEVRRLSGGAEPRPYAWPVGAGVPALMAWTGCRWAAMMRHRRR